MTIPEIEQQLKELCEQHSSLQNYANKLDNNLSELRRQLGVENHPTFKIHP